MAVGKSNSGPSTPSLCNYYKVATLTDTIIDPKQTSNLEDRYLLGEELGWGQFGVIRLCSDKLTGEILACKSIAKDRLVTPDNLCSVKLEIEIMTRLSGHPNVVDLKAVYEEENYVHLVMELCEGGELFHRLEKHGHFLEPEARTLFKHLMEVVLFCHKKGIVHRDLKPENILFATKSLSSPIKLADFGLATYIKEGQSLHGTVGSPFYIAPEVLSGGYNQAADVWSAGVILYILLSGMPPFWGKTKSRIFDAVRAADLRFPADPWDQISASAMDLITGMLCTDSSRRLTAAQVLDHSWIKGGACQLEPYEQGNLNYGHFNVGGGDSFSTPLISGNRDLSFDVRIAVSSDDLEHSPAITCRYSFSSFLVDSTPCPVSAGFSFHSCGESNSPGFPSPIPSMPSFNFFSPSPPVEQENQSFVSASRTKLITIERETSFGKILMLPDSSQMDQGESKQKGVEIRRGGATAIKTWGIHSRRNQTIGLGELEQLDLTVTESVIRWSSCTHLSSNTSLRSSLVC